MAWERRRNQRFYYRSVKVGGKVKKVYFGKGPEAELAAMAAEQRQRERTERAAARRVQREHHQQVEAALDKLSSELEHLITGELAAAGCREHGDQFKQDKEEITMLKTMPTTSQPEQGKPVEAMADVNRPQGASAVTPVNDEPDDQRTPGSDVDVTTADSTHSEPPDQPPPPTAEFDFRQLVELANKGDRDAMARLREVLDCNPQIWQRVGDLAAHARLTLVRLIATETSCYSSRLSVRRRAWRRTFCETRQQHWSGCVWNVSSALGCRPSTPMRWPPLLAIRSPGLGS